MRCAVLGDPIAHSLSPVLHRAAYAALGLDWTYEAVRVPAGGLRGFLDGLGPQWRGLSLTMPLKREVLPLADELTDVARTAGAANTLVLDGRHRTADNTDVPGAVAAVRERYDGPLRRAVLLGAGATAASTGLALADLGCGELTLLARDAERAAETVRVLARHPARPTVRVEQLGAPSASTLEADVVVSTVPVTAQTPDLLAVAEGAAVVFDVVYDPWPTRLDEAARTAGQRFVSGLDLLAHQAALQVARFTGRSVDPGVLRSAGLTALPG